MSTTPEADNRSALLARSGAGLAAARTRALAELQARIKAVDDAGLAIKQAAASGATAADIDALRRELDKLEAHMRDAVAALANRLDAEAAKPPPSWRFDVLRDSDGAISGLVARPLGEEA